MYHDCGKLYHILSPQLCCVGRLHLLIKINPLLYASIKNDLIFASQSVGSYFGKKKNKEDGYYGEEKYKRCRFKG